MVAKVKKLEPKQLSGEVMNTAKIMVKVYKKS